LNIFQTQLQRNIGQPHSHRPCIDADYGKSTHPASFTYSFT